MHNMTNPKCNAGIAKPTDTFKEIALDQTKTRIREASEAEEDEEAIVATTGGIIPKTTNIAFQILEPMILTPTTKAITTPNQEILTWNNKMQSNKLTNSTKITDLRSGKE